MGKENIIHKINLAEGEFNKRLEAMHACLNKIQTGYPEYFPEQDELFSLMEITRQPLHMDPRKLVLNRDIPYLEKNEIRRKCESAFRVCMMEQSM